MRQKPWHQSQNNPFSCQLSLPGLSVFLSVLFFSLQHMAAAPHCEAEEVGRECSIPAHTEKNKNNNNVNFYKISVHIWCKITKSYEYFFPPTNIIYITNNVQFITRINFSLQSVTVKSLLDPSVGPELAERNSRNLSISYILIMFL